VGELEHLNLKINRAYLLKELFAHFWTYRRAGWAKRYLKRWFWWAPHARLPPLRDFAWMLRRQKTKGVTYDGEIHDALVGHAEARSGTEQTEGDSFERSWSRS
jgi:hypothetical protein